MLIKEQLHRLSKIYKTNESIVAREFIQVLFLKELYSQNFSKGIFFKGGTCIRLIYGGQRFSEDLDFTVMMDEKEFDSIIEKFFREMENKYPIKLKEKESFVGKTFLITARMNSLENSVYIKLDFSFRKDIINPSKEIIMENEYPVVFTNFIYCLSKDELLAGKIRAFLNREKYRDIYDIWMLLELGAKFDKDLVQKKLDYYKEIYSSKDVSERMKTLSSKDFASELKPFVSIEERDKLEEFFVYICRYIEEKIAILD